ncbi:hypothetical protein A0H81_02013 [Grifola frondosa]|uniref:Uncharacterized protein n=1 Tax=Grifola frondosa TaxID=5627 RepID=A0A1C7MS65_GRIFR|nr:hypothetical protein A0H81_02013 [Grifola frondosa]
MAVASSAATLDTTTAFREAVSLFAETFTALSTRFLSGTVAQAAYLAIVATTFAFAAISQVAFPLALFTRSFLLSGTVAQAVHLAVAQAAYLAIVATTFAFAAISQVAFPLALFTRSFLLSGTVAQAVHLAVAHAAYLTIVAATFAFAATSQAAFPLALFTRSFLLPGTVAETAAVLASMTADIASDISILQIYRLYGGGRVDDGGSWDDDATFDRVMFAFTTSSSWWMISDPWLAKTVGSINAIMVADPSSSSYNSSSSSCCTGNGESGRRSYARPWEAPCRDAGSEAGDWLDRGISQGRMNISRKILSDARDNGNVFTTLY